jgi:hypothetical protein
MFVTVSQRALAVCIVIGGVLFVAASATAQNTITPKRIEELNTSITWDSSAFADIGGSFRS